MYISGLRLRSLMYTLDFLDLSLFAPPFGDTSPLTFICEQVTHLLVGSYRTVSATRLSRYPRRVFGGANVTHAQASIPILIVSKMAVNVRDFKLASTAAGFTLGFGLLTTWEAIKQTRALKSPLRSVYIYMVWGEILVNLLIGIIAWLFLDGTLQPRYSPIVRTTAVAA